MRASREAGQPIGFSDAWQREGGIFGFLSSLGNANMAVGAGSSMVRAGDRIWGPVYSEKARPIMWDVPIRENTKDVGNLDFNDTFEVRHTIAVVRYVIITDMASRSPSRPPSHLDI